MTHFTIPELCASDKAVKLGISNYPTPDVTRALEALVTNVLDPARALLGASIRVNSGYRSPELNKAVKGAATSQHLKGEAADLNTGNYALNKRLFELIRDTLPFDQLINEHDFSWVHVSFKANGANRKQLLKIG